MAAYLIYVPGPGGPSNDNFARVGLDALVDADATVWAKTMDPPPFDVPQEDMGGYLATWQPHLKDHSLNTPCTWESAEKWVPSPANKARGLEAKRFWVGIPPGGVDPVDIARAHQLPFDVTVLRDDFLWRIPIASSLPHTHGLDEDGCYTRKVQEQYRDFYAKADTFIRQIFEACDLAHFVDNAAEKGLIPEEALNDNAVPVDLEGGWDFCCEALCLNYKLSPEIISMLELLDDGAVQRIIGAVVQIAPIIEVIEDKKKAKAPVVIPVGSSSSAGG